METIPILNLLVALLPAAVVVFISHRWVKNGAETLYGFARMFLQLSLIGYFLIYIFEAETPWPVAGVLLVMILVASWISLRSVSVPRHVLYPLALVSVTLGGGVTLLVVSQGVLTLDPWFAPRYLIPLAGMVFSASMTSISLASERLEAELARGDSYSEARSKALKAALIPITNSLFAVGLVSLPGMMTGQILSGVSPLVAARYQIMVMAMLYGAAGLSAACFLTMLKSQIPLFSKTTPEEELNNGPQR
ncbi:MAG: hypothetical protein COB37_02390 [Kordiimonadales bacterium]|nr:MAG: hypothetical protein COB37_02390 [Kordiimonadales bacterium]